MLRYYSMTGWTDLRDLFTGVRGILVRRSSGRPCPALFRISSGTVSRPYRSTKAALGGPYPTGSSANFACRGF